MTTGDREVVEDRTTDGIWKGVGAWGQEGILYKAKENLSAGHAWVRAAMVGSLKE